MMTDLTILIFYVAFWSISVAAAVVLGAFAPWKRRGILIGVGSFIVYFAALFILPISGEGPDILVGSVVYIAVGLDALIVWIALWAISSWVSSMVRRRRSRRRDNTSESSSRLVSQDSS
jgi:hypothetical protein